jgi:cbb3-type cytochrome oxidase subunit 3
MSSPPFAESEYETLRATIRERGTMRICLVLGGMVAWAALVPALLLAQLTGVVILVPLLVLATTFELNFFVHTGVERIGRYLQVFFEDSSGSVFVSSFSAATALWIAISLLLHVAFSYRIVSARKAAASQRAIDLDRFRSMLSK